MTTSTVDAYDAGELLVTHLRACTLDELAALIHAACHLRDATPPGAPALAAMWGALAAAAAAARGERAPDLTDAASAVDAAFLASLGINPDTRPGPAA